ncbi:MAG: hypothetical protein GXY07_15395 [Candidatus Hydrogenedentes bacterium]|nr:hypothetical protein [Candidatus Hydrogenedentota bacterium]
MKKHLSFYFCQALVFSFMLAGFGATAQIAINNIEDLQQIGLSAAFPLNGNYVLARDIDATETASWANGAGFAPIGDFTTPFTGNFDGQDHVIRGLVINRPVVDHVGLFSAVGTDGSVRRLGLTEVSITGKNKVGSLAGINLGDISYCYATGTVACIDLYGGGLVALNDCMGTILSCYADTSVSGRYYLGGLAGENIGAIMTCFATGNITGTGTSGGLIGYHNGILKDCYARTVVIVEDTLGSLTGENGSGAVISRCYGTGLVQGSNLAGGLTGFRSLGGSTTASYWDTESTLQLTSEGGEGRTTDQMTHPYAATVYEGWNFDWVWAMDTDSGANDGYPYLRDNPPPTLQTQGCAGCGGAAGKLGIKSALGDYLFVGLSAVVLICMNKARPRG